MINQIANKIKILVLNLYLHLQIAHFARRKSLALLFLSGFFFSSTGMTSTYSVMGVNSARGNYTGFVEVKSNKTVVRIIQYDKAKAYDLSLQEVWTGKATSSGPWQFLTRSAHYIFEADEKKIDPALASQDLAITIHPNGRSQFTNSDGSISKESNTLSSTAPDSRFQFAVHQQLKDAASDVPLVVRGAIDIAKIKMNWSEDPAIKALKARSRCQNDENAKILEDFTDLSFYQNYKDTLRVYNSPATIFSAAEALYRRAAFSTSFSQKVAAADKAMDSQFINAWGMSHYFVSGPNGSPTSFFDYDSALWTGQYLAYLNNSFAKNSHPELLERVKKTANGILLLVELFAGTHEFGRTLEDLRANETVPAGWRAFENQGQRGKILLGGNNDMYKGLLLGLIATKINLPKTEYKLHARIDNAAQTILKLNVQSQSNGNKLLSYGLAALTTGSENYRKLFEDSFHNFSAIVNNIYDGHFYWNGTSDYSGLNLAVVASYTSSLVAKKLNIQSVTKSLINQSNTYKETFRPISHLEFLLLNKNLNSGYLPEEERLSVEKTLATLPYPRPQISVTYDHSWNKNFCLSPIPSTFWKALGKKKVLASEHVQTLTSQPLFTAVGISSNYFYKDSNFQVSGSSNKSWAPSPIDILFTSLLYNY